MVFRKLQDSLPEKEISFNSEESEKFLKMYNENKKRDLIPKEVTIPKKRFSPSSLRCKRMNWFKFRGVVPEVNTSPDVGLNFIASVGTHCHETIQSDLVKYLGDDWISVSDYLNENPPQFQYELSENGYETKVSVQDPPVGFSVDGIVRIDGKPYLLEIKTSEAKSMKYLIGPKPEHLDQIICYCTMLGLDDALVVYQDRNYGSLKCFTKHVSKNEKERILNMFEEVQEAVRTNKAPEGLPRGDKWCKPGYCKYYHMCKQWG